MKTTCSMWGMQVNVCLPPSARPFIFFYSLQGGSVAEMLSLWGKKTQRYELSLPASLGTTENRNGSGAEEMNAALDALAADT